jgi:hypothetical protein
MDAKQLLQQLGVDLPAHAGKDLACRSPIDGAEMAVLRAAGRSTLSERLGAQRGVNS